MLATFVVCLEITGKSHILPRMMNLLQTTICKLVDHAVKRARRWLLTVTRPTVMTATDSTVLDLTRSKPDLVAENGLLRHQLVVLARTAGRPRLSTWDRVIMILASRANPAWRDTLMVIKPATLMVELITDRGTADLGEHRFGACGHRVARHMVAPRFHRLDRTTLGVGNSYGLRRNVLPRTKTASACRAAMTLTVWVVSSMVRSSSSSMRPRSLYYPRSCCLYLLLAGPPSPGRWQRRSYV